MYFVNLSHDLLSYDSIMTLSIYFRERTQFLPLFLLCPLLSMNKFESFLKRIGLGKNELITDIDKLVENLKTSYNIINIFSLKVYHTNKKFILFLITTTISK